MTRPTRHRVAVVYQHLPHYREPVFRLMSETADIEYHFLAAPRGENGIHTVPFGQLPNSHALSNHWLGPFLVQGGLFTTLRRIRPDAVIFLGDYRYITTWINAVVQRTLGARVFFWTQGWRQPDTRLRALVRNSFYRTADHLLVYGSRARELGIDAGFSPDTITAIGNSEASEADLRHISTSRTPSRALRIGAVMRLSPNKKTDQLAEIAAALRERGITTHVHIAGEGPGAAPLKEACASLDIPLRQLGALHSDESLSEFYADLDVCVIPGAAGLSVLQALSHGTPVVTSDNLNAHGPEVEALTPGVTGAFVPEDDAAAFADAIATWAARLQDDGASIAATCVESVRVGWVAERQADHIAQLVRGHSTARHNIAVINPNASLGRYSGPNIFMQRLFADNERVAPTIVTGNPNAVEAYPWARVAVPTRYNRSGRLAQLKWMLALTWWLWRNARRFNFIHAHGVYLYNLLPLRAAQLRKVPVVLVPLGENAELRFASDTHRQPLSRPRRAIVARATLGLGLSRKTEKELIAAGLAPGRVGPIGNPVDTELFRPPADDQRFGHRTIGFIGVLGDRKGAQVVLEALSILRSRPGTRDVRALFVGPYYDEAYEERFTATVNELGLNDVVDVTGFTQSVAEHVHQMTVMALPSNQEGLPGALVEALSCGLPAVVTEVGAMGDVVRAAEAGHVIERSADALATAIESVMRSEGTWRELSQNARAFALSEFSINSVQSRYLQRLDSVSPRSKR